MQMVTTRNFTRLARSKKASAVVLFANDTPAGRRTEQKLSELAASFAGAIRFLYVDTDRDPEIASVYKVWQLPVVILFVSGEERWRAEGKLQDKQINELSRLLFIEPTRTKAMDTRAPAPATPKGRSMLKRAKSSLKRLAANMASPTKLRKQAVRLRGSPEREFELKTVIPLLNRWGLDYSDQAYCFIRRTKKRGRIDFLVNRPDSPRPLTLFEDKASIITERALERAVAQADAYARARRLPSFVIAAPEGLWVYSRPNGKPQRVRKFSPQEVASGAPAAKQLLIELSRRPWAFTEGARHG